MTESGLLQPWLSLTERCTRGGSWWKSANAKIKKYAKVWQGYANTLLQQDQVIMNIRLLAQADDPPVSFWCAFRIFSLCLFDRSYQMLTEKATFSNTLGKCLLKVITLMLNTATGLWQSQQTETGLWRRTMFCNVLPFFHTSNKGKTLPCAKT